jgi:hypothetical protein
MHAPFPALLEWSDRKRACAWRINAQGIALEVRLVIPRAFRAFGTWHTFSHVCMFGRRGWGCRDSRGWRFLVRNSFLAVRGGEVGFIWLGLIGMLGVSRD